MMFESVLNSNQSYFRYLKSSKWRRIVALFFAVSIFGSFREVANSAKIQPSQKFQIYGISEHHN